MNIPEFVRSLSSDPLIQFFFAMCLGGLFMAFFGELLCNSKFFRDLLIGKDNENA
ncbi:hypothetical protein [Flectobacillus rivi]|uniref:Uncharacterized protein n=1 Tax=Flectobacillus rivi TaxID=2984209 RepID=A0ABT6Z1D3_9BACT|nr:hypothetical protein [Flectobacillus rivi]MDI9874950.1 hypothetical protein [Flectobacillus rivi]